MVRLLLVICLPVIYSRFRGRLDVYILILEFLGASYPKRGVGVVGSQRKRNL